MRGFHQDMPKNITKITYISNSTIPSLDANSIQVLKMCQAFIHEGFNVTLLAPRRIVIDSLKNVDLLEHYGINYPINIDWLPVTPLLNEYDYSVKSLRYILKSECDLVYTRSLGGALLTGLFGLPVIYEAHDFPIKPAKLRVLKYLFSTKGFIGIVAISNSLKLKFVESFEINENKILVEPDCVDLERFDNLLNLEESKKLLKINPHTITVGYAGHLYKGRGVDIIYSLAKEFRNLTFLIIGGKSELVNQWKKIAEEENVTNIIFFGFIQNAFLPTYLSACDVLLMPYQRKVESAKGGNTVNWMSPMKMFEYMATKRLIVASDLPAIREVLNEQNSILCDPDNFHCWVNAIESAILNPRMKETLSNKARQDVLRYTWNRRAKRIIKYFFI
jgi:glycosyltransferase involved in cell wall biosynthesis